MNKLYNWKMETKKPTKKEIKLEGKKLTEKR
jgi:hypothetical protein